MEGDYIISGNPAFPLEPILCYSHRRTTSCSSLRKQGSLLIVSLNRFLGRREMCLYCAALLGLAVLRAHCLSSARPTWTTGNYAGCIACGNHISDLAAAFALKATCFYFRLSMCDSSCLGEEKKLRADSDGRSIFTDSSWIIWGIMGGKSWKFYLHFAAQIGAVWKQR